MHLSARAMIKNCGDAILTGKVLVEDIPSAPVDAVRIYLSSTATDFIRERTAITEKIAPRIRSFCRAKYGVDFQLVDLHWTTYEAEVSEDQLTMDYMSREIHYCQNCSLGPSFVAFVGQRYGHPPLPVVVPVDEMETIRASLVKHRSRETRDMDLLYRLYILDRNNLPPVFRLAYCWHSSQDGSKPLGDKLKQLSDDARQSLIDDLASARRLLSRGAEFAINDGTLDRSVGEKYITSSLEQELKLALSTTVEAPKRCLVFVRSIVDLAEHTVVSTTTARRFAELIEAPRSPVSVGLNFKPRLHPTTQKMLGLMRDKIVEVMLPPENVKQAKIIWRFDDGICPEIFTHAAYIEQLCEIFYSTLTAMIRENFGPATKDALEVVGCLDRFKLDALQSWYFVGQMVVSDSNYIGYDFLCEAIQRYVHSGSGMDPALSQVTRQPLLIVGSPGSGKSTLIARTALGARDWLSNSGGDVITVIRFCGLNRTNSSLLLFLESICRQIQAVIPLGDEESGLDLLIPPSEEMLVSRLWKLLASVPKKKALILLIDSAERLSTQTAWLPTQLPPNVSVVVTVTAESAMKGLKLCSLSNVIPESNVLQMAGLNQDEAAELLNLVLLSKNRQLSLGDEVDTFLEVIKRATMANESECVPPLYIVLLGRVAATYGSSVSGQYTLPIAAYSARNLPLPESLLAALQYLFEQLECTHGYSIVSTVMMMLATAGRGLTDCECEDVLSMDSSLLAILNATRPPFAKLSGAPPALWNVLRADLRDLMLPTWETGQTAWWWRQSTLSDYVRLRYIADRDAERRQHSRLVDYWLSVSSALGEPTTAGGVSAENPAMPPRGASQLDSRTSPFPGPLAIKYSHNKNFRKLLNLPHHLAGAERWREFASCCLFSYDWIYQKTRSLGLAAVIDDYTYFVNSPYLSYEASLVAEALRELGKSLEPLQALECLSIELSSRLLPYCDISEDILSLVVQCDFLGSASLLPLLPHPQTPGSALLATLTAGNPPPNGFAIVESPHDEHALIISKSSTSPTVKYFPVASKKQQPLPQPWDIQCSVGRMLVNQEASLIITVDPTTKRVIKLHDVSTGQFRGQIIPSESELNTEMRPPCLVRSEITFVEQCREKLYICLHSSEAGSSILFVYALYASPPEVADLPPAIPIASIKLPQGKCRFVVPSKDGTWAYCGIGSVLSIVNIPSSPNNGQLLLNVPGRLLACTVSGPIDPAELAVGTIFALCDDDPTILMIHDHSRLSAIDALTFDGARIHFTGLKLSPRDSYLALWNRGIIDILTVHSTKQLTRLSNPFGAPPSAAGLLSNESLSGQHAFSEVLFTPNEDALIAAAGRWLLIWRPVSGQPVARLQAELGILEYVAPLSHGHLLVTHVAGSPRMQVWNLIAAMKQSPQSLVDSVPSNRAVNHSEPMVLTSAGVDKLPGPIQELVVAANQQLVYARMKNSATVGVYSLVSGRLIRLLEHDAPVLKIVPVASGQFCLASTEQLDDRRGVANRLWDVVDSRTIWKFGNDIGYAVACHSTDAIIHVARFTGGGCVHDPYGIYVYRFTTKRQDDGSTSSHFEVEQFSLKIPYALGHLFVTMDDSRAIFLAANSYNDKTDTYSNKSVCVCDLKQQSPTVVLFGVKELCDFVNVADIYSVQPCPNSGTHVVILYAALSSAQGTTGQRSRLTSRAQSVAEDSLFAPTPPRTGTPNNNSRTVTAPGTTEKSVRSAVENSGNIDVGCLILDSGTGTVIRCCDRFMAMSAEAASLQENLELLIADDMKVCTDAQGALYDLSKFKLLLPKVHERGLAPKHLVVADQLAIFTDPTSKKLEVISYADCRLSGWMRLWSPATSTTLCRDGRTLVLGCADGSIASVYVLDKETTMDPQATLPLRGPGVGEQSRHHSELLQLFASGRDGATRMAGARPSYTAPVILYKEGRMVADLAQVRAATSSGNMSSSSKQLPAAPAPTQEASSGTNDLHENLANKRSTDFDMGLNRRSADCILM